MSFAESAITRFDGMVAYVASNICRHALAIAASDSSVLIGGVSDCGSPSCDLISSTGRLNVFPSITRSTVTVLGVVVGDDAFYW